MIAGMTNGGSFLRPAQTYPSRATVTPAGTLSTASAEGDAAAGDVTPGIAVSSLRKIDTSGLKIISAADNPQLRDLMAANWLQIQAAQSAFAREVPDNAPQNTYATVKVDGKVVATLYNAGSVAMTNAAAGQVGKLQDPPGLGGPDLAQWRADYIAKAVGGTVEKASTAIAPSEWTPRQSVSTNYSRAQLDAAFQAMLAEGQRATALAGYANPPIPSGHSTDVAA